MGGEPGPRESGCLLPPDIDLQTGKGSWKDEARPQMLVPQMISCYLCASLQRQIFEDENKAAVRIVAGDNVKSA